MEFRHTYESILRPLEISQPSQGSSDCLSLTVVVVDSRGLRNITRNPSAFGNSDPLSAFPLHDSVLKNKDHLLFSISLYSFIFLGTGCHGNMPPEARLDPGH